MAGVARPAADVMQVDALGANGAFRARNRMPLTDVAGADVAELSLVPSLFVDRTMAALRRARPPALDDRIAMLTRAAELFATATLGGQTVEEYQHAVCRVGGTPIAVIREATARIAARLPRTYYCVDHARPTGSVIDWRDPMTHTGRAVWARRGGTFAVHAAGNHPGPHGLWPEALALGYRVAVRPSRREPFTPYRLITALRAAGFGDDQVALLPTDHDRAGSLLTAADLGMVYGGADVVARYGADPTVLVQGPGRSKILVTADADWRDHLDTIVDSVAHHGGVGCVNTTAVFVEGDPTGLCEALAERLSALPSAPPEDPKAVLAVQPVATANAIAGYARRSAADARRWHGDTMVDELGDGSAVLRPAVYQLDRPDAPQTGVELPFPCVWVAPWTPEAGVAPLRHSLVLTAITGREPLIGELLDEPTISNLHVGDHPTYWMAPELPHDGYLADFLMRTKTFIR